MFLMEAKTVNVHTQLIIRDNHNMWAGTHRKQLNKTEAQLHTQEGRGQGRVHPSEGRCTVKRRLSHYVEAVFLVFVDL